MIESRNLFKLQSRIAIDNKTIPVKTLEKNYILAWILTGISKAAFADKLTFKGGTALKKIYFQDYRFSEDLDFTLTEELSGEEIEKYLYEIFEIVRELANIPLSIKNRETHISGYTFYINFSGPLGADIKRGEIKTDFTHTEKIIHKPVRKNLIDYHEYDDIPKDTILPVYPLEEIFIEKYLSILDKRRNEPRDLYDLWYLCKHRCLEYDFLSSGIKEKGGFKGITDFNMLNALNEKEGRYTATWEKRLSYHMLELPEVNSVLREIRKYIKKLNDAF